MRKRIGILTGGGDVPGLTAAIKAFVYRLLDDEQYEIVGLRRGWAALINVIPDPSADNSAWMASSTSFVSSAFVPPARLRWTASKTTTSLDARTFAVSCGLARTVSVCITVTLEKPPAR